MLRIERVSIDNRPIDHYIQVDMIDVVTAKDKTW
ncbi:unnamed protein product [Rhodiola kirilowii]